jgi:uncharacterized protein YjeT (DUF2065 family)
MVMLLTGIGLVLVVEGLFLALAPGRIVELLAAVARMPVPTRQLIGMTALVIGAFLLTLAAALGG